MSQGDGHPRADEAPSRTAYRLSDLSRREWRRVVLTATLRSTATALLVFGLYFLSPVGQLTFGAGGLIGLAVGIVGFALLLAWQVRRTVHARLPGVQAVEAMLLAIPTFIVIYAATYATIDALSPRSFSEPLDKVGALYFTIVTLGTVGYGDIAPTTILARLVVSSQILLDLVLIATVVRLLLGAARRSLGQQD